MINSSIYISPQKFYLVLGYSDLNLVDYSDLNVLLLAARGLEVHDVPMGNKLELTKFIGVIK